jgi:hypothetical protein
MKVYKLTEHANLAGKLNRRKYNLTADHQRLANQIETLNSKCMSLPDDVMHMYSNGVNRYNILYEYLIGPILDELNKKRAQQSFNSMHIADQGCSIKSLHGLILSKYAGISWNWIGNKLIDPANKIADPYDNVYAHIERWMFGTKGTGDISIYCNCRSIVAEHIRRLAGLEQLKKPLSQIDLYVSNLESSNYLAYMGMIYVMLKCLSKSGNAILRINEPVDEYMISIVYFVSFYFSKIETVVVDLQCYLVCHNRGASLDDDYETFIASYMNNKYPAIGIIDVPNEFIEQLKDQQKKIYEHKLKLFNGLVDVLANVPYQDLKVSLAMCNRVE